MSKETSPRLLVAGINHPLLDNLVDLFFDILAWRRCRFLICTDTGMPKRHVPSPIPGYVENFGLDKYIRKLVQEIRHGNWDEVHIFGVYHRELFFCLNAVFLLYRTSAKIVYHPMGGDVSSDRLVLPFDEIILNSYDYRCLLDSRLDFSARLIPYGSHATRSAPLGCRATHNCHSDSKSKVVMVGNSADQTYRHVDILNAIEQCLQSYSQPLDIFLPLSYHACPEYVTRVKARAKALSNRFNSVSMTILTDLVDPRIYYKQYLSKVTHALLLDGGKTGWSQLSYILCNGGSIYLANDSPHLAFINGIGKIREKEPSGYCTPYDAVSDIFERTTRVAVSCEKRKAIYADHHSLLHYLDFWVSRS